MSATIDVVEAVEVALTELLVRDALGDGERDDAGRAKRLCDQLDDGDVVVAAAARGAMLAAWQDPSDLPGDVRATVVAAARALLPRSEPLVQRALGAAALLHMTSAGLSSTPVDDLLATATCARETEQHQLCAQAARTLLGGPWPLGDDRRTHALLLLALATRDSQTIGLLDEAVARLAEDHPLRTSVAAMRPTLQASSTPGPLSAAGAAVAAEDRERAARELASTLRELAVDQPADRLLGGLTRTLDALAQPQIDVAEARAGLREALTHFRERRRLGTSPPVATAGLEIALALLTLRTTADGADLLCELMEVMADGGLSSLNGAIGSAGGPDAGAIVHALMSDRAARDLRWPALDAIVGRLGEAGTDALLTHARVAMSDGVVEVVAAHIRPPNEVALKRVRIEGGHASTLELLSAQRLAAVGRVSREMTHRLLRTLMPVTLRETAPKQLLVVPSERLWSIPWHTLSAGTDGERTPIAVVPSLSLWSALEPVDEPIAGVVAFVDERIPASSLVRAALSRMESGSDIRVIHATRLADLRDTRPHDLLLLFCHGGGSGLDYRLQLPDETVTALELAAARPPARALVAACDSAAAPPVAFPLSVPAALLLAGCRTVVGGLWPLPAAPTAAVVASLLDRIAAGRGLADARDHAVASHGTTAMADVEGLTLFGRRDTTAPSGSA